MALRRLFFLLTAGLLVSGLLLSCQPWDLPLRKTQRQCTSPSGQIGTSTALLQATLTIAQPTGDIASVDWDFGDGTKSQTTTGLGVDHTYAARGTYTVKATLTNLCKEPITLSTSLRVTDVTPPIINSVTPTNIAKTTATLRMMISSVGKGTISEYGFCYSKTNPTPTVADQTTKGTLLTTATQGATLSLDVSNLEPGVTYYVRAYARNEANPAPADPSYSTPQQFRMLADPAINLTGTPTVTGTSTVISFQVTDTGNPTPVQYGVVYAPNTEAPTVGGSGASATLVTNPVVPGTLSVSLSGLTIDQNYTYRPFARLADGTTVYGPSSTFSTIDLTSDLLIDVPFTNRSMSDLSGNNNTANPIGSPAFTSDRKNVANAAIQLNGNGQYFYFLDNAQLRPTAALTVSFWIRANAINDRMQLYNKSRFNDNYGEQYSSLIKPADSGGGITINTDIKQNSNCVKSIGWQTFAVTSNLPVINQWRHIVFTYSGRTARMYLDGTLLSEKTDLPASSLDNCDGGELKFGAQIRDYPQYFNGAMDDVRVYRRALTATQVKTLFGQ